MHRPVLPLLMLFIAVLAACGQPTAPTDPVDLTGRASGGVETLAAPTAAPTLKALWSWGSANERHGYCDVGVVTSASCIFPTNGDFYRAPSGQRITGMYINPTQLGDYNLRRMSVLIRWLNVNGSSSTQTKEFVTSANNWTSAPGGTVGYRIRVESSTMVGNSNPNVPADFAMNWSVDNP